MADQWRPPWIKLFFLFLEPNLQFSKIIYSGGSLKKIVCKNVFIVMVFLTKRPV